MDVNVLELLSFVFLVVGGILPIANPFSTAPLFVSLTAHMSHEEQISQANRACLYMALILVGTFFVGAAILDFFGITIPAIRLAGGLIILYIGFGMLFPKESAEPTHVAADDVLRRDFAFTPLAMPMLSGPGSIAVVIELSARVAEQETTKNLVLGGIVVTTGILITVLVCWIVLRGSRSIVARLGAARIDAVTKFLGFLLMAIGIEFAVGGIRGFISG